MNAAILLLLFFSNNTYAQKNFNKETAKQLITANAPATGLSADDIKGLLITNAFYDNIANVNLVYVQQTYKNIPVYNAIKTIGFRDGKLVTVAGSFYSKLDIMANNTTGLPELPASAAVTSAASNVDKIINTSVTPLATSSNGQKIEFPSLNVSKENIVAKLLWVPLDDGKLILSWQIKFVPVNTSDYWLINVDAQSGNVIGKDNLTVYEKAVDNAELPFTDNKNHEPARYFSPELKNGRSVNTASAVYRVVPYPAESPIHPGGAYTLVTDPFNNAGAGNPVAALGWHNDGTMDYNYTRGNNVWAREDRNNTDGVPTPGRSATSTTALPSLSFDFPFNESAAPTTTSNQDFAITQLFYWNNIMHDITYQYGFDEVSGNFQNFNNDHGGLGGDFVYADAQDGSGTNNANFATPEDGQNPRMQMYLFNASTNRIVRVTSPSALAGFKAAAESNVSTANKLSLVGTTSGNVVLYNAAANDGCTTLSGTPLSGSIALIDGATTSTCTYAVKIKNAQSAGAIGVIVIKSTSGTPPTMSGSNNTITIPAVMVTLADGNAMKAAIQSGAIVNVTLNASVGIDGDVDNGVMAHEYAHGISNRLTGGSANASCLVNREQMGEGWSDYYALMTTTNWQTAQLTDGALAHPIGNYVLGGNITDAGIRTYPYSTNLAINPWTYALLASQTSGESHNIGEIWATVLWEMTWGLIQMNGINPDLYNAASAGGNSISLKLVTEGLKLQSCRPGFLDGRDGILKADTLLYNGQYSCAIWKAFAKRGMGVKAKQGSSDSYTDQTADYTLPDAILQKTVDKAIADQNEDIRYTLKASCKCTPITNYKIVDTINTNLVDYVSGGTYDATAHTVTFSVPSLTEGQSQSFNFVAKIKAGTYTAPVTPLAENVTSATIPATFTATATGSGAWSVNNTRSQTGTYSFKATDPSTASVQTLTSTTAFLVNGLSILSFYHYFDTEPSYDGGVVELSTGGNTWFDAGPYMFEGGYNNVVGTDSKRGFSGSSSQFILTKINLSSFSGKQVKVRFVFTSDSYVGADGWYIDDIMIENKAGVFNVAALYNSSNGLVNKSDTSTIITNVLPLKWGGFTALKDGRTGLLKWTTLQEQNTNEFLVERSNDASHFAVIGSVKAAGSSSVDKNYSLVDGLPIKGINYYRIRQVDNDGRSSYSEVRSITFDKVAAQVSITPNPAKGKVAITVPGNIGKLHVTIFTTKGEKAGSFVISGEYNRINLPAYAPGVYYVTITGENMSTTQKLVIE